MKKLLFFLFVIVLTIPYLVLFINLASWESFPLTEFKSVFTDTVFQSTISALLSVILGFWGALGLLGVPSKKRNFYKLLYLIPNFLPLIFVIISSMLVLDPFPFGLKGIILLHVFINMGLVAVFLVESFETQLGGVVELATIEGASKWQTISAIFPMVKRDLFLGFLTVFSLCFSSFVIPSIVGGFKATTIEVLIYQKVKVMGEWSQALSLSGIQALILFLLALLIQKQKDDLNYRHRDFSILKSNLGFIFMVSATVIMSVAPMMGLFKGFTKTINEPQIALSLPSQVLGTLLIGWGSGTFCLALFLIFSYILPGPKTRRLFLGYVPPSTVLVGFSLLLIMPNQFSLLKIIFGLTILTFPLLYRLRGFGVINALEKQIEMGMLLGASHSQIFNKIIFPQTIKPFCQLSGLCAFWAAGDFALSSIISGKDISVGLLTQGLLQSYRIDQASVFVWIMMVCGVVCFLTFSGLGYVISKKFSIKI